MESQLLECLEALSSAGDDERARLRKVSRTVGYEELPKSWRALVRIAAAKTSPKRHDDGASGSKKSSRRAGRRVRRSTSDPREAIIADEEEGNPAFRLCRHILSQPDVMKDATDASDIRKRCDEGVHPAWERLAREAPIFAELSRFPVLEVSNAESSIEAWLEKANFDPIDHPSMYDWLSIDPPMRLSPKQRKSLLMLRREYSTKVDPRRVKRQITDFETDTGVGSLFVGIMMASIGEDAEALFRTASDDPDLKEIATLYLTLNSFRHSKSAEEVVTWIEKVPESKLSYALTIEAWQAVSLLDLDLDLDTLTWGGDLLDSHGSAWPAKLSFMIASKLIDGDRLDGAREVILGRPMGPIDVLTAVGRFSENDEDLVEIASESAKKIETSELIEILYDGSKSVRIRTIAAREAIARGLKAAHLEVLSDIATEGNEIELLSEILVGEANVRNPMRGLLVWHLLSARIGISKMDRMVDLRKKSIEALERIEDPCLSEVSVALLAVINGFSHDLNALHDRLGTTGIKALNQTRRALLEDGTGIVRENSIGQLITAADNSSLGDIESSLFDSLITSLRLNRARIELQMQDEEKKRSATETLVSIVNEGRLSLQLVISISEMIEEYHIALPVMEEWYREHAPDSSGSQIVRAAISIGKGDHLNAGRCFLEAARRLEPQRFERTTQLRRMALIHFAHAKAWKQAVDLVDRNAELMAAITRRFQLFLRVCSEYDKGRSDVATNLVLGYASDLDQEERTQEINGLRTYPDELGLPSDPFEGRVKAALKRLDRPGRRNEDRLERRLKEELQKGRDVLEISLIAQEQAEKKPLSGLRMFQSAINHGGFDEEGVRRLRRSQRSMFTTLESSIPIKDRRTFNITSLKPLVIVDTNLLVDAFKDELIKRGSPYGLGNLDWSLERAFQWALRRQKDAGSIKTYLPESVMREFFNRTRDVSTSKRLFHGEYQDQGLWSSIENAEIEEIRNYVIEVFSGVNIAFEQDNSIISGLNNFLESHSNIFAKIDESKRQRRDDEPSRSVINGDAIYPEEGDRQIIIDAASLASYSSSISPKLRDVGSVLVATRDSDFRMIRRSLEEQYGFVVVENADQITKSVNRS